MRLLITLCLFGASPALGLQVRDDLACAAMLEASSRKMSGPIFDRAFTDLHDRGFRELRGVYDRTRGRVERMWVLLELAGSWGRSRLVRFDDKVLNKPGEDLKSWRHLKTLVHRAKRVHARQLDYLLNPLASREVIVGKADILKHLDQVAANASRMHAEFQAASNANAIRDRLNAWRFGGDALGVVLAGVLAGFNLNGVVQLANGGGYLWAAANLGVMWVVARPILRAKIESMYLAGRDFWWRGQNSTEPAASPGQILEHVADVKRALARKNREAFVYLGATVDLDLRRADAPAHPFRRAAPTASEIVAGAIARKGRPRSRDRRRVELDALFTYNEQLKQFVYARQIWEPKYATDTLWWGW